MFENQRYLTKGVSLSIPPEMILLLWYMIEAMPEPKDYLQVFDLSIESGKQKIIHKQEQPPYEQSHLLEWNPPITAKLFVIDDNTHSTMLLAEEY
ncbi:DUF960 domain-containing protein [Oscillospiraceae bacterium PP1C4]